MKAELQFIVDRGLYIIWKIALIIFSTFFQSTSKLSTSELKIKTTRWCSLRFLLWKQATSWALILFHATEKKQEKNRKPDFLNHRLPENDTQISWYVDRTCNGLLIRSNNSANPEFKREQGKNGCSFAGILQSSLKEEITW